MSLQVKQKGNILIYLLLVGLVFAGVAGGYYLGIKKTTPPNSSPTIVSQTSQPTLSPTSTPVPTLSDETANWKVFNGDGFSFRYPNSWNIAKTNVQLDSITLETEFQSSDIQTQEINTPGIGGQLLKKGQKLTLDIANNKNFTSSDQYMNSMEHTTAFPLKYFKNSENITIGGSNAILKSGGNVQELDLGNDFAYFYNNGKIYEITFRTAENDQVFRQVLSTFKFTN